MLSRGVVNDESLTMAGIYVVWARSEFAYRIQRYRRDCGHATMMVDSHDRWS
jgi:hypothetical protein